MNKRNRFGFVRLLLWGLGLASSVGALQASDGDQQCSNATLTGSYGLHATGNIIGIGDFAAVGLFTFDGKGHLTGKLFIRENGTNLGPNEFTGTYVVNPDCTVQDVWGGSTHVSVIVDRGNGYLILNNTVGAGNTISGEAKKLFPE
jgi:hypothetical protein